ncbi:uncharacterized protein LOC133347520 isoform X1 [Lethenteron reissneri]|uniref:uncharacterized protein LOC133347520 isoform X1 n=1 Tax=Lethenteron reissneri TaxID=7753 RepID=UPI002AB68F7B|nr:uncharacterized protein LOC133347520 isoform X1 [Lethenteron reissneri]
MQAKKIFPAGFITSLLCLAVTASAAAVDDCTFEVVGNMGNLIDNFVNQLPLDYGVTVWGPQDNRNSENCFEKNPFEMALESLSSLLSQLHNGSNVSMSGNTLLKTLKDICHSNETVCLCQARVKPDSLATALKRLTKDVGKSEGASSKCLSSPATTKDTESTASPVPTSAANTDATSRPVVPPASSAPAAAENMTADATSRPAVSDHCANGESRAGMSAESPSGVDTWRIPACVFMGTTGVLLVYLVAGWHCERRRRSLATHWSMRNCHVPLQHAERQTLMALRSATGTEADNQSDDPGTVDNLV